jgi:hypothetical protein
VIQILWLIKNVFTLYAVCLQNGVHKAEVPPFLSCNQKPDGNNANTFRLLQCRKKIAVNITDGSCKKRVYFNLFLAVLTNVLPTAVKQRTFQPQTAPCR